MISWIADIYQATEPIHGGNPVAAVLILVLALYLMGSVIVFRYMNNRLTKEEAKNERLQTLINERMAQAESRMHQIQDRISDQLLNRNHP